MGFPFGMRGQAPKSVTSVIAAGASGSNLTSPPLRLSAAPLEGGDELVVSEHGPLVVTDHCDRFEDDDAVGPECDSIIAFRLEDLPEADPSPAIGVHESHGYLVSVLVAS